MQELNIDNPYRDMAISWLAKQLAEGGVPIPAVSSPEFAGAVATAYDYERDDFNGYEVEVNFEGADGYRNAERFHFAAVEAGDKLPKVVSKFSPVFVNVEHKDFDIYLCSRFKRPKTNLFLLSLDLETGDFAGPKVKGDGSIYQGHEEAPILQIAGILTDRSGKELVRFDHMLDSDLMDGLNPDTKAFHVKTGFWDRWEKAERVTLDDAVTAILSDLEDAIGQISSYHYHARNHIVLLGKSIWFDRAFLMAQSPVFTTYLSHQMIDVSVVKPILKEVNPNVKGLSSLRSTHMALDDCESAIAEYKALKGIVKLLPNEEDYADEILESMDVDVGAYWE